MCEIVYNILITNFTVHRCIIRSNAPSNLQMQPLGCIFVYALNCITFGTAIDKAVTGLIQRIPQKGLISGIFANGRPTRSYFFALSPEMLNAVGCIIQRTEAVRWIIGRSLKCRKPPSRMYHSAAFVMLIHNRHSIFNTKELMLFLNSAAVLPAIFM